MQGYFDVLVDTLLGSWRFVAARMGARTMELASSHDSPLSHPHAIAELIEQASRGQ